MSNDTPERDVTEAEKVAATSPHPLPARLELSQLDTEVARSRGVAHLWVPPSLYIAGISSLFILL